METLKIINLSFQFDSKKIFTNLNLELELGKFYAISGSSGVGKSTFAHLISGHLLPSSGSIYLGSKKITKPLRDIFIVHQEDDLFPWLTVIEQLTFVNKSIDKSLSLLNSFKLQDSLNLYPNELSGGMKKRLALIRAELVGAKVLILDETLSSLDKNLLQEILAEMVPRWKSQKITIIFITHQLDEIKSYVDEVINF